MPGGHAWRGWTCPVFGQFCGPREDMSSGHVRPRGHVQSSGPGMGTRGVCPLARGSGGHARWSHVAGMDMSSFWAILRSTGGHVQWSRPAAGDMSSLRARGWAQGEYVHCHGPREDMSRGLTGEQEQRQQHGKPPKPPRPHGPVPPPPPAWLPDLRPR